MLIVSEKIENITNSDLEKYKKNTLVRRSKEVKGGFEKIVYATDQDLDGFHIRGLLNGFIEKYLPEFKGNPYASMQIPVIVFSASLKSIRFLSLLKRNYMIHTIA